MSVAQLSGTFTVGGASPDYADPAAAIADLNAQGVGAGGVTFQIRSGTYAGSYTLTAAGTATDPIVFQSVSGNPADVTLENGGFDDVMVLDGAAHITFRNLTIDYTGSSSYSAVQLEHNADNTAFDNCRLNGSSSTSGANTNAVVYASEFSAGDACDNLTVRNCAIADGGRGLYFDQPPSSGLVIEGCDFSGQAEGIMEVVEVSDVSIARNTMPSTSGTFSQSVFLDNCTAPIAIERNNITGPMDEALEIADCDGSAGDPILVANNMISVDGGSSPIGIHIDGSSHLQVVYNSVNMVSANGFFGYAAMEVAGTITDGTLVIRNNIFACSDGSSSSQVCFFTSSSNLADISTLDYNNYYITGSARTGYISGYESALSDWQTATSMEANGLQVDPEFASATDLHINPVVTVPSPLSGAGTSVGSVSEDFDGDSRPSPPDIGADQFTAAAPDEAGVTAVAAPATPFCSGTQPVAIVLRNFGSAPLTEITIDWTVNGTAQPTYNNTGLSIPAGGSATLAIGSFNFLANTSYAITATSSQPNGNPDPNPANDAHTVSGLETGLSGSYTINSGMAPSATNFQSLQSAISELNSVGVCGPVDFTVASGSGPYTGQLTFSPIPGAGSASRITFQGNGETIAYDPNSTSDKAIVHFDGADYITLADFTVRKTNASNDGIGVLLNNQADHNRILNSTIDLRNLTTSSSHSAGIAIADAATTSITNGAGENGSYNSIRGNTILGPTSGGMEHGIAILGTSNASLDAIGNEIIDNTVQDFYEYGIYVENTDATLVRGNDVSRPDKVTNTTFWGIRFINDSENARVAKNRIHASMPSSSFTGLLETGISFDAVIASAGNENYVQNNAIYDFNGTVTSIGIASQGSHGVYYLHNTIVMDGPGPSSNQETIALNQTGTQANTRFENNLIQINRGGSGDKIAIRLVASSTINSNHNVIHFSANAGGTQLVGRYASSDFPTLADWQTANGGAFDQHSAIAAPMFSAPASGNFLPTQPSIETLGTNLQAEVGDDILDNARPTNPTPGAWQAGGALPLTLLRFDLRQEQARVRLTWGLSANAPYEAVALQRSAGSQAFEPLHIDTLVSTPAPKQYSYTDWGITAPGVYRYRLKLRSPGGAVDYSAVRQAIFQATKQAPRVGPNPAHNQLTLRLPHRGSKTLFRIVDPAGRTLKAGAIDADQQAKTLSIQNLPQGLYILKLQEAGKGTSFRSRFIKQ